MVGDKQTGQGGLLTQLKNDRLNHLSTVLVNPSKRDRMENDIP